MSIKQKPFRLSLAQLVCKPCPPLISQRMREAIYSGSVASEDDYSCAVRAQTGSVMEGVTSDFHFQKFCVNGFYEWRSVALCLAIASPGDTIIEAGSNIGTETISFADIVGPRGRVHAIEPLPFHVQTLRRLNETSQYKNITVHPCALSRTEGVASFVPPPRHHSGVGHLAWDSNGSKSETITVNVKTLDSLSKEMQMGPAKLVVTDLEGEELNFLHGASSYIAEHRPYLLMEAAPPLLQLKGQSIDELFALLFGMRYEVYGLTRFGLRWIADPRNTPDRENWFCVPREIKGAEEKVRRSILRCGLAPFVLKLNPLKLPRL